MSTNYPGSLDSYTTKVDGVDDVLAAHINDPQDAIEAIEAQHQQRSLLKIKNGAGATVAAGDVGYINSAGNFARTTTANLDAAWAVVIVGGANNTQIVVCRRGRVTITLDANCSIGDYLYTSTTAGQAAPLTYVRSEVLAVALTANTGGAGGTCEALLLTGTTYRSIVSTINIVSVNLASTSDFVSTIATLPGGAVLTYGAVTSGHENTIDVTAADLLGKIRLYNSTRGTYGLIDSVVVGTNTITLTVNVDAGWQVGDAITTRSQTAVYPGAPPYLYEIDLSSADNTVIPITARAVFCDITFKDSAVAGAFLFVHPWEAYATAKVKVLTCYVANVNSARGMDVPLIQQRFVTLWSASGVGTVSQAIRVRGWWEATP